MDNPTTLAISISRRPRQRGPAASRLGRCATAGFTQLLLLLLVPDMVWAAAPEPSGSAAPVTHLDWGAGLTAVIVIAVLMLVVGLLLVLWRGWQARAARGREASPQEDPADRSVVRSWLALALVGGLLVLVAVSFWLDDQTLRSALAGGVVAAAGAAVAFYFASRSSDQARKDILTAIGASGAKSSALVEDVMIPAGSILFFPLDPSGGGDLEQMPLPDLYDKIKDTPWQRIPVFEVDQNGKPTVARAVVHKQVLATFAANNPAAGAADLDSALVGRTIADLDKDSHAKIWAFTEVAPGETVADARKTMKKTPQCADIFVTEGGAKGGKVLGWLTNSLLATISG